MGRREEPGDTQLALLPPLLLPLRLLPLLLLLLMLLLLPPPPLPSSLSPPPLPPRPLGDRYAALITLPLLLPPGVVTTMVAPPAAAPPGVRGVSTLGRCVVALPALLRACGSAAASPEAQRLAVWEWWLNWWLWRCGGVRGVAQPHPPGVLGRNVLVLPVPVLDTDPAE